MITLLLAEIAEKADTFEPIVEPEKPSPEVANSAYDVLLSIYYSYPKDLILIDLDSPFYKNFREQLWAYKDRGAEYALRHGEQLLSDLGIITKFKNLCHESECVSVFNRLFFNKFEEIRSFKREYMIYLWKTKKYDLQYTNFTHFEEVFEDDGILNFGELFFRDVYGNYTLNPEHDFADFLKTHFDGLDARLSSIVWSDFEFGGFAF